MPVFITDMFLPMFAPTNIRGGTLLHDVFKAAAKAACEKIVGETPVGLKTQYTAWKTRLETEADPKMRRKLEAAIQAADAVA